MYSCQECGVTVHSSMPAEEIKAAHEAEFHKAPAPVRTYGEGYKDGFDTAVALCRKFGAEKIAKQLEDEYLDPKD